MTRWLLSFWSWSLVRHTGVHAYLENAITGDREVLWCGGGHQPIDHDWLAGGEFQDGAPAALALTTPQDGYPIQTPRSEALKPRPCVAPRVADCRAQAIVPLA